MTDAVALVTCGPADHGITTFGRQLAAGVRSRGFDGIVLHEPDPAAVIDVAGRLPPGIRLVHLQANDWLFSGQDQRADGRIAAFAAVLRGRGAALSLTLHDLPQQGVSRALFLRRADTYSRMIHSAVGVVVSSEHERLLIAEAENALAAENGTQLPPRHTSAVEVIPLPLHRQRQPPTSAGPAVRPTIGVLGFIYPGKGHLEILEAAAGSGAGVVAIGRPSAGHEGMLDELLVTSGQLGVGFTCTGYVADADLIARLHDVTVPVAPHPQVSASASINSWIAAGRRPLVRAGRYTQELNDRMPGSVWLYEAGELGAGIRTALADPGLTCLPPDFRPAPDLDEVASRYLSWLRSTV